MQKAVTNKTASSLVLTLNGKEQELADAKGYILSTWFASPAGKGGSKAESDVSAPAVFAGFGVTAPDQKYDDYTGVDVRGKIVVGFYGAPSTFPSTERAYYSDGIVKAKNEVARGAVGVVSMMIPEDWKRYPWEWLVPQIQAGEMHWLDKNGTPHDFFPELRGNALLIIVSPEGNCSSPVRRSSRSGRIGCACRQAAGVCDAGWGSHSYCGSAERDSEC